MAQNRSQVYKVDERYKETKGAVDNNAALGFLKQYAARDRASNKVNIEAERKQDDRFIVPGQAGTLPVGALGLGQQVGNTDGAITFKNSFRATQA
jgi:phospholipase C